ncbi:hypothetical protein [Streptomyces aidingensis]|uniref:Uncharacterized protein n=1 Tax=Streptomyces aidingensis TaxID=910347 RepID=A0A1I1V8D2_9ACTN|nr:hypothetical protein [Streptomyces aidingensis]SFD79272.1 hypothetical protein SAMN05421773_13110 [Streptomyces aidingensis]
MGTIRTGKPDARPDTPGHVPGIHQGNEGPATGQPGHHGDGTADARRSTGVNPKRHNATSTIMPNLPPG